MNVGKGLNLASECSPTNQGWNIELSRALKHFSSYVIILKYQLGEKANVICEMNTTLVARDFAV